MESTVKQRITDFIKYKGISVREFERQCGLSNGYVNSITQTVMPNKLKSISLQYPELNLGWITTGEGQMIKRENLTTHHAPKSSEKKLSDQEVYLYDITGFSFIALKKVEQGDDVILSTIAIFAVILSGMMFYGIQEEKTRSADDWLKRKPIIIRAMPTGSQQKRANR